MIRFGGFNSAREGAAEAFPGVGDVGNGLSADAFAPAGCFFRASSFLRMSARRFSGGFCRDASSSAFSQLARALAESWSRKYTSPRWSKIIASVVAIFEAFSSGSTASWIFPCR